MSSCDQNETCISVEGNISRSTLTQSFAVKADTSKWRSKAQYVYILGQIWWIMKEAVILIKAMGWGIKWLIMTVRTFMYGFILLDGFLRSIWWYMNSPTIFRRVNYREDTNCLDNNRAYLDIYYPFPVFQLMRSQMGTSPRARRTSDRNFSSKKTDEEDTVTKRKYPVVISVCGGGWIIGSHYWNAFAARVISMCGYVVVCPDYRNFPQATIPLMIDDISDAIAWTFENIDSFCGDSNRVTAIGQSAGAHLLFCSIAQQLAALQQEMPAVSYEPAWFEHIIGLSGMYDLVEMETHLHRRGLYRRVLKRIAGPDMRLPDVSPPVLYDRIMKTSLTNKKSAPLHELLPKYITFIHGTADCSAPCSEAEKMYALFKAYFDQTENSPTLTLRLLEGQTHTDPIVDLPLRGSCDVIDALSFPHSGTLGGSSLITHTEQAQRRQYFTPLVTQVQVTTARYVCPF